MSNNPYVNKPDQPQEETSDKTRRFFKLSVYALILAALTLLAIPAGCELADNGRGTWDDLDTKINILIGGIVISLIFMLVSVIAALKIYQQKKIVLIWAIPLGILLVVVVVYLGAVVISNRFGGSF